MKRNKFSLSHYKLLSLNQGLLIPIGHYEVLPGDTVQHATSALVRAAPLVAPVMHPVHCRIHHWFVPYRLLWDEWEDFITGGPDGMNASDFPHIVRTGVGPGVGTLGDYLGVPEGTYAGLEISALPYRAYNLIWNENYRDQDLQTERVIQKTGGVDTVTERTLCNVAWEKDYFTSSRPFTQKGPEVTLPIGGLADVVPAGTGRPEFNVPGGTSAINAITGNNQVTWNAANTGTAPATWSNPALAADLSSASAVTINQLREAFAIQRYEEARARYGSRYVEYLAYLGVRSSDARLQRPEYLGGGKQTIQFSEVLQTAEGTDPVGMLRGHGIGAMRSNRFRRFFEEHGIVMSLMSIKPRTVYMQAMNRSWFRQVKEDFWQRELEHIGQQAVYNREIYAPHPTPNDVFGYQDRYDEYRRMESGVAGEFRTVLNYWHMARDFAAPPVLNGAFVAADPTNRVYAATTSHQMYVMANHSIQARRQLSKLGTSHIF